MRLPNALWILGAITASAAFSAAALGQGSTWGGKAPPPAVEVVDAGVTRASTSTWGGGARHVSPVGVARDGGAEQPDDEEEEEEDDEDAAPPPAPAPADDGGVDGGGGYEPSDVGFNVGIRGGYGVPFGNANGAPLNQVAVGMGMVGVDIGWNFTPHFYLGGYFLYGFGLGADLQNSGCNDTDISCSAAMIRVGMNVRYHFAPAKAWDPWVGAGLGYELINASETDATDGSSNLSSALQAFDATLEGGIDFKPIHYMGFGPYVEIATGPYVFDTGLQMHGWATFGARFRTNL
jgi:hypothetical protein